MNIHLRVILRRAARLSGLALVALLLGGCFLLGPPDSGDNGTGDDADPDATPTVYVGGYAYDGSVTDDEIARFWQDGTSSDVKSASYDAVATGVGASGSKVVVAGYYRDDSDTYYTAFQQVNGTLTNLSSGTDDADATHVFVDGSDVYVAGRFGAAPQNPAGYWKNGTWVGLPSDDDGTPVRARDITVVNGSVYVAGTDYTGGNGYRIPVVWVDGTKQTQTLPTGTPQNVDDAIAWGVATDGTTVFASGEAQQAIGSDKYAVVWEDGAPTVLDESGEAIAYAVEVHNGKVYAVGYIDQGSGSDSRAALWTIDDGAVASELLEESAYSEAYDIHIAANGNRYVAGYLYNGTEYVAAYWLNGTRVELDTAYSWANAIVVR